MVRKRKDRRKQNLLTNFIIVFNYYYKEPKDHEGMKRDSGGYGQALSVNPTTEQKHRPSQIPEC